MGDYFSGMSNPGRTVWFVCVAVALGGSATAAPAQAPMTAGELKTLLATAATKSHEIDSLNTVFAGAQLRAQTLIADYAKHNAEPCEYPQGHPELCASYDRERQDLNLRSATLQKEMKAIDAPRRILRIEFADVMTRLRTASYPGALASQKTQLVACANLNGVAESAACLVRAQRRKPS